MIQRNVAVATGEVCLYPSDIREHMLTVAPADPLYQDVPWSYSFNAHHDIYHMIELSGGADTFVSRLEKFFEPGIYDGNDAFNNTLYNPGNQPAYVRVACNLLKRMESNAKRRWQIQYSLPLQLCWQTRPQRQILPLHRKELLWN